MTLERKLDDSSECNYSVTCIYNFQLEKCSKQFDELSKSFGEMYQTAFDADPVTLTNIHMYPHNVLFN